MVGGNCIGLLLTPLRSRIVTLYEFLHIHVCAICYSVHAATVPTL